MVSLRIGLAVGAKPEDIKAAFHKLAKRSHPDVNADDSTAGERFKAINQAYEILSDSDADAVIVGTEGEHLINRRLIVELAEKARLPTMYPFREFVEVGGLMAYAIDQNELFRIVADQIDQILRGTKPGEIPYYLPTKFELLINFTAAKTLGLTVPPSLLAIADEVIE